MLSKLRGSPSGPDRIVRNGPDILSVAFLGGIEYVAARIGTSRVLSKIGFG